MNIPELCETKSNMLEMIDEIMVTGAVVVIVRPRILVMPVDKLPIIKSTFIPRINFVRLRRRERRKRSIF